MSNCIKISPLGAELFRTDGHDEANSRFRNYANATKLVTVFVFPLSVAFI
jgi:hypothetical protein